jgi:radical SAM superfamily enzyme YgiQ (UPF0313 family)
MNIVLITPTPPDINAFGMRMISSVLKKEGFRTKVIFLPGGIEHLRFDSSYIYRYPEHTLRQITDLCRGADLIGISLMSLYFDRAAQITDHLRKELGIPIIWGGVHPTYRPEQCLEHAEMICMGEGERAIIELAQRMSRGERPRDIRGCWFKHDGVVNKNEPAAIIENLDELPFVDYDIEDHYVFQWRSGDVVKIDEAVMKEQFLRLSYFKDKHLITYRIMTSRGCPHKCSYCASSATMRLRRRSVDNVMRELEEIRRRFPYVEAISLFDDTFFAAPVEYFEEFTSQYKKRIGLPLHAQCSPTTLTERKLQLLLDAGLFYTEMGLQTGSDRIKKLYRRMDSNEKMIEAAALLHKHRSAMLIPDYHVILDNPWETTEDVQATLRLLLSLPGKFKLQISSLVFFPGTELNDRARQEGILKDELNEVCRKPFTHPKATYLNYLIFLSGFPAIPRWFLRLLSRDVFVKALHSQEPSRVYHILVQLTNRVRLVLKGMKAVVSGDFGRITNYFKLAR